MLTASSENNSQTALTVESTASLSISGAGSLSATGTANYYGAGIGNSYNNTGSIAISGGTIMLSRACGHRRNVCDVTISGGSVTAKV
jgi:hypothetical protein